MKKILIIFTLFIFSVSVFADFWKELDKVSNILDNVNNALTTNLNGRIEKIDLKNNTITIYCNNKIDVYSVDSTTKIMRGVKGTKLSKVNLISLAVGDAIDFSVIGKYIKEASVTFNIISGNIKSFDVNNKSIILKNNSKYFFANNVLLTFTDKTAKWSDLIPERSVMGRINPNSQLIYTLVLLDDNKQNSNNKQNNNIKNNKNNFNNFTPYADEQGRVNTLICSKCNHTGLIKCEACNGTGSLVYKWRNRGTTSHSCGRCHASGKMKCKYCDYYLDCFKYPTVKKENIVKTQQCSYCNHTGKVKCNRCNGGGYVLRYEYEDGFILKEPCPICSKKGLISCPYCNYVNYKNNDINSNNSSNSNSSYNSNYNSNKTKLRKCPGSCIKGKITCTSCLNGRKQCLSCGGTGHGRKGKPCGNCHGAGEKVCGVCGGAGYKLCSICGGDGYVER